MATTLLVRGSNPVWSFVDLTGHQFDDSFYMWVLENDIPYFPATVWQDISGNVPWTSPIQFLANGTLPVDIFWDPAVVYRLEFRQHLDPLTPPTQADALIYLVENYQPGSNGTSPIENAAIFTDNQITNPQFADISFSPPLALTSVTNQTIEVGPGWTLELTGTGNVTLERLALNSTLSNPSNAPYALRLQLSSWDADGVILRQRFQQNGMLWASTPGHDRYVSSSITARIEGAPQFITARLVDSMNTLLAEVLSSTEINDTFNEYKNFAIMPATTNTNTPPDAYIDYELKLPSNVDIYITSFQLVQSEIATVFEYEQDTIDRQIDHTWHYYRNSVVMKPKSSILSGWNFSLNPMQFYSSALTTASSQCQYVADQTIIYQLAASTVKTGKKGIRNAFQVKAISGVSNNRFALIQYIDPATIKPYWSYILSSLARMRIFTSHGTEVGMKMRLIWRTSLPSTISPTEPIASWASTDPVFASGWTAIAPQNDPVYILPNSYDPDESGQAFPAFPYDGFEMPDWDIAHENTYTLGIVIYSTDNLNSALGTEDTVEFDRISLVPNDFAVDSPPQTADEVLRECQYYYEANDGYTILQNSVVVPGAPNSVAIAFAAAFRLNYQTVKRAIPAITLFSTFAPFAANTVFVALNYESTGAAYGTQTATVAVNGGGGYWLGPSVTTSVAVWLPISFVALTSAVSNGASFYSAADITMTFNLDARLGV